MYLPLDSNKSNSVVCRIPFIWFYYLGSFLPMFSFITCVIITIIKDSESANHTHCNVPNVFPSISAAIGGYNPQSFIWKLCIYSHFLPRLVIIYLRLQYYCTVIHRKVRQLVLLAVLSNVVENFSLLGLTFWNSSINYPKHEICFKIFIAASIIYMLTICILLSKYRRALPTNSEQKSLSMKWRFFLTNVIFFALAAYFFIRHNRHCEPFVYSLFGLSEYVVVITNIAFHMTTIYDFNKPYILFLNTDIILSS